jgi:DNA-binding transcriptional ArsR family regulator
MKEWTKIYKALANQSRLGIIQFLSGGQERNVTDISAHIHVLMAGASRHLSILENVGIIESAGKSAHIFYYLNPKMPRNVKKAVSIFLDSQ